RGNLAPRRQAATPDRAARYPSAWRALCKICDVLGFRRLRDVAGGIPQGEERPAIWNRYRADQAICMEANGPGWGLFAPGPLTRRAHSRASPLFKNSRTAR